MEQKERFRAAFEYLKSRAAFHTQKEAAQLMQASSSNMSSALAGDPKVLTKKFLTRFNDAFGDLFNIDWLLTGSGSMLRGSEAITAPTPTASTATTTAATNERDSLALALTVIREQAEEIGRLKAKLEAKD